MPPTFDRRTGELIEPARSGRQRIYIMDSDDQAAQNARLGRGTRIKQESPPLPSPEIKSEDEGERSATLSLGRGRHAQYRSHTRKRTSPPSASQPRTPTPRAQVLGRPSAPRSAGESSYESSDGDRLTPSPSPSSFSDSSSEDSDATFRPSRSPSKFPNQTSPTTRNRSRFRHSSDEHAESVANPRPIEVVIRSVRSAAHGSGSCRAEAEVPATQHGKELVGTTSVVPDSSPASSVRHGWRFVNGKKNRAKTPASSSRENHLG